jgi:hypothetical protein
MHSFTIARRWKAAPASANFPGRVKCALSGFQPIAMRASQFFIATLKEAPSDAEIISHQLMLRAGLIRRLAGGIYTWMPMGLRVFAQGREHRAPGNGPRRGHRTAHAGRATL